MLVLLGCASMAAAQCVAPSANVFDTSASGNCSAVDACKAKLTTCQASATCNTVSSCYGDAVSCMTALSSYRTNSSSPCYAIGNAVYLAQLLASASSSMNNTALQNSCNFLVCQLQNQSSLGCTANLSTTVCTSARLLPSSTPTTNPTGVNTVAVTVTIRISGANWTIVLADPVKKASAVAALLADLAALLGIDVSFLSITGLTAGSLTINLAIYAGSGKTADALISSANSASGSSAWMTNTKSVYATVGSDTLTTLSVSAATATPAPAGGTTTSVSGSTTAAPGSSAVGAAGVWAVAAVAAVAALLA